MTCDVEKLNDKDAEAILALWEPINNLTTYGIRSDIAGKPSVQIQWSNAAAKWFVSGNRKRIESGTEIRMDASDIIVPFSPMRMDRIIDCLPKHPLYRLSLEAGERGVTEDTEKRIHEWALTQRERLTREKWK